MLPHAWGVLCMPGWIWAIGLLGLSCLSAVQAQALNLGITPLKAASALAQEWTPLIEEVGKRAGVSIRFRTAPSIPEFGERLGRGEYDLAYMNPYHYQQYSAQPGYRAFARERQQSLEGVLLVRRDGPVRSLVDLNGATVSFPTPLAFAASILTQAELAQKGIRVVPKYVQSHDSVLKGVLGGSFVAGGTIQKVLDGAERESAQQLVVLHKTAAYASHPVCAHPRVAPETVRKVAAALESLHEDPLGKQLLKAVGFKGFEPARDQDYDSIRKLGLDRLIEAVQ